MRDVLRRNRATIALVVLLVAGAIAAQLVADRSSRGQPGPPLSSRDASPTGSLALALWLERLGYRVGRLSGRQFAPDDSTRLAFVLEPIRRFDRTEARATLDWVRRGGTLVYVPGLVPEVGGNGVDVGDGLSAELGVTRRFGDGAAPADRVGIPAFPFFTAPAASRFAIRDATVLDLNDDAWVPLARDPAPGRGIVVATRQLERGRVYVAATDALFSNAHVADADNASVVLNVLARLPPATGVTFDEYHHGEASAPDLTHVALASPWGWAILYAAALTFVFALWAGRRFGPALVTSRAPGQSGADYVAAFAGLLQRQAAVGTDAIGWAQHRYARHVRQRLARAHAIPADLPPGELARVLGERRPIDADALERNLAALDGPTLGDKALLARVRELEPVLRVLLDPPSQRNV